jgi:transcriptional regulator with XRE-family HTH domain
VDAVRLGAVCRALRIKKAWRQSDLAIKASVTRSDVSRLERGKAAELRVEIVLRIVAALGGRLGFSVWWFGGELDRLLNARHAALHESVARSLLTRPGWALAPEVSFAIRGERGVIDILAWHEETQTLLVIELKTEIVDISDLMGSVDRKRRLAASVARDRGWIPSSVSVWVIVGESVTNRRRVWSHSTTLRAAFPSDGRAMRSWLRSPSGGIACLSFWSNARGARAKTGVATVKRVRRPGVTASAA